MKLFATAALMPAFAQVAAPTMQMIVPIDVVALTQAFFTGIAAVGGVVAAIYAIWAKRKADQAAADAAAGVKKINAVSVQIDGLLADRDRAKIIEGETKGKQAGVEAAAQLAEGQRQGMENERAAAAAASGAATATAGSVLVAQGKAPVAVEDERTAEAAEAALSVAKRSATAQESMADAAQAAKPKGK